MSFHEVDENEDEKKDEDDDADDDEAKPLFYEYVNSVIRLSFVWTLMDRHVVFSSRSFPLSLKKKKKTKNLFLFFIFYVIIFHGLLLPDRVTTPHPKYCYPVDGFARRSRTPEKKINK